MRTIKLKSYTTGLLLAATIIIFSAGSSLAQIKIGTNGTTIAPASLLELESANQGLLLPRMADTAAINALNPPNGMLIYLTKVPAVGLYVRKVTGWEYLTGSLGGNGNFNSLTVAGTVTAGNFTGPLNGNSTSANTSLTSTNSLNSAVINDLATGQPTYPIFVTQTPGNAQLRTSTTKLSFVPNTGILTAVGFAGPLVGDVTGNASSATNSTNASNTDITDDLSTNAVHYPTFVSATTGNLPHKTSSNNLSYTPQTGELKAVRFLGNLTGNASSSDNAITTTITNDNVSGSVVYPTFVTNTSGNWGQRTAGTKLTFVPATGLLTAGSFASTIPTGTAPFSVASTTTVPNLSATNTLNTNITDDAAITSTVYPTFVTGSSGNLGQRIASSRLSFIPSTGALSATSFVGTLNGNAATATLATNFTGNLAGNVTGTQGATLVESVGGIPATGLNSINSGVTAANSATASASPNTIVLRNSGGDFSAGTITATLNGNANNVSQVVAVANGGTGQSNKVSSFNALSPITTAGDLIYGNGTNSNTRLAAGGNNTFLKGGATPSWSTVNLGAPSPEVTGVLPALNGGAGAVNGILKANGSGLVSAAIAGTDFENLLTFSSGLTRNTNTVTVNTTQNIARLSNLTTNGLVTTSGANGTLAITAVTGTGDAVLSNNPVLGNITATQVKTDKLIGSTTIPPSIAAGTGAGVLPNVVIAGSNLSGLITVTTGTVTVPNQIVATITYSGAPFGDSFPILFPANSNSASLTGGAQVYTDGGPTTFTINAGLGGLAPLTTYRWNYQVAGN